MRLEWLEPRRVLSAASGVEPVATLDPTTFAADRVLVKFRQPVAPSFTASATSAGIAGGDIAVGSLQSLIPTTLTSILDAYGASDVRRVFPSAPSTSGFAMQATGAGDLADSGDEVPDAATVGLDRWYSFDLTPGTDISEVLAALSADGAVEAAEPDYLFKLSGLLDGPGAGTSQGDEVGIASLPSAETDPAYSQQWHLDAVKAPEAWAHLESLGLPAGGRSDIVIAVIDTGVDYTHPDLAANMWVNAAEIPGNGIDDDGNGFVDDIHGAAVVSDSRSHSGNPMDDNGHGTHVAGIAAASADNDIGGVGIAYNARIMGIKAFQYSGVGASTDIAEAIYYAVENGADIINMSFGSYSESSLVKDALQVAFGTSVLVAAAGNDGRGNLSCPPPNVANMYPAAYNWVLGVMASTSGGVLASFSNKDCVPNDAHEYEILAPGAGIYSTLPGGTYSAWSGTSMAAPVVSGMAALLRTEFADENLYSSRFIMGQLAVGRGGVIDAARSLTDTPRPNLSYRDHFLFDTTSQDAGNDADGRVDAGETVDLAITIRNHWGRADNVTVTLDAFAAGAIGPDPFVTMITDTVSYGAVGTFNEDDNGLIYEDGVITGVTSPFRFNVAANTPNEHVIPFRLTITATNGLDPGDQTVYTFESRFTMSVQRGRELPSVIAEDMVLTKDDFWIVSGPVLIPAGVTVRIDPGTQVQWGTSAPTNPYAEQRLAYIKVEGTFIAQGTFEEPVKLFASQQFNEVHAGNSYRPNVRIYNTHGTATLDFVEVDSPEFSTDSTENHEGLVPSDSRHWLTSITRSVIRGTGGLGHASLRWDGRTYVFWAAGFQYSAAEIRETLLQVEGLRHFYLAHKYSNYDTVQFDNVNDRYYPWSFAFNGITQRSVFLGQTTKAGSVIKVNATLGAATAEEASVVSRFSENAILNKLWSPDVQGWLRVQSTLPRSDFGGITNNYWGTESNALIDRLVIDQRDDFNLGTIVTAPFAIALEETYPFAVGVTLTTQAGEEASRLSVEPVTFTVTFNRDMDTSAQPQVGFGPAFPYTDHTVNGDWVDARTWQGTYNVTPLTGDGYQLIRVAGARAADKPWLVTGNDAGRFRFEIVTSGTQSMNLQASGGEGKVDLSWTQDDFDLLAGYNIYRATTVNGTYTRVNSSIIPKEQTAFTDTSVQPAQTYFYKFRIVKTDSTESVDSNVAAAAPLDTIPPVISHTALTSAVPNFAVTIRADVTDNRAVQGVTLHYRPIGQTAYQTRAMTLTTGSRYSATLDAATMIAPGVEYYLSATDGVTTVYHGLAAQPHRITVVDRPVVTTITPASGPSTGGTSVTIAGSNFKSGASVIIGGAVAADVTVVSATQITATAPAGVPAYADVRVVNSDDGEGALLGGYRYVAEGVLVSVPSLSGDSGGTIEVPISLADVAGLRASELTLSFDAAVLRPTAARVGPLATGWSLVSNMATAGQVRLTLAGATGISATGVLAYVSFDVLGAPNSSTALTLTNVSLNDGAIAAQTAAGTLAVNDLHAISGLVRYWSDSTAIAGAAMFLAGEASLDVTTDSLGAYTFTDLREGDYTLMPDKQADVRQITAYDAALVLQAAAGVRTLSGNEALAADVNRRNGVSALDAAYILEKSVGLMPGTFPNAGTHWVFTPAQRTYTGLAADQLNQHFTGILLGDVSGNWAQDLGGSGLSGGIGIQSEPHQLSIGSTLALPGETGVRVPVRIELGSPAVYAADLTITYDAGTLSLDAAGVALGEAATGMALAVNTSTPGVIRVGLAGVQPVAINGDLLTIEFTVAADAESSGPVAFGAASLNEGLAGATTVNGAVTVTPVVNVPEGAAVSDPVVRTGGERIVKTGAGTLILDQANSHSGGTVVEAGELVIRNPAALGTGTLQVAPGAKVTLDVGTRQVPVSRLELSTTSTLDLGQGSVVLAAGDYDLSALRLLIASARNGGNWSGNGITSSAAQSEAYRAVGHRVLADGSLQIGYAAVGDATLDGVVDIRDLIALNANRRYGTSATDTGWWQGDFNFDGRFNVNDLIALSASRLYGAGSYLPAGGGATATAMPSVMGDWTAAAAFTPEPIGNPANKPIGPSEVQGSPAVSPEPTTGVVIEQATEPSLPDKAVWAALGQAFMTESTGDAKAARWRLFGGVING